MTRIELRYDDAWVRRLKWIGDMEIECDWRRYRPKWLENMELQYDQRGYRLKWIGDVELHYERRGLGSLLRRIDDMELGYEKVVRGWFDDRPKYTMLPDEHSRLAAEKLLLVSFVLYEKIRREEGRELAG